MSDCIIQCSLCFDGINATQIAIRAATNGHANCLKYIFNVGCDILVEGICNAAANKGNLECLTCARTFNCPWSANTFDLLLKNGNTDCINFARENGCPSSDAVVSSTITTKSKYTSQNELLLNNLIQFYKDETMIKTMLSIVSGDLMSLRIVDWFTTNYAKKEDTTYTFTNKLNQTIRFNVYSNYRLKLKSYTKKRFDPFCRWERIQIPYKNNTCFETTIGQLNFFKWALENKIIDYITANYDAINADMVARKHVTSKIREPNTSGNRTRKKREELSISASKSIKRELINSTLHFH